MRRSSNPDPRREIRLTIPVGGTGSVVANVFKVHGPVRILEQIAEITEVTTLTNLTNLYATTYDGTNTVNLTADGAVLSGAQVETTFTRDKASSQPFSVSLSDQVRVNETVNDRFNGLAFTITPKHGADTFIQMRYTTLDNPVDFVIFLKFVYEPVNGGYLTVV